MRDTWPDVESHCLIEPSAEIDMTLSFGVQAMSQMASVWARGRTFDCELLSRTLSYEDDFERSLQSSACRKARLW